MLSPSLHTGANWANDRKTGKSTSGGAIVLISHWLRSWSAIQSLFVFSSAEFGLYVLGVSAMANGFGMKLIIRVFEDVSAAWGIIRRRRDWAFQTAFGTSNVADFASTELTTVDVNKCIRCIEVIFHHGRAQLAVRVAMGEVQQSGNTHDGECEDTGCVGEG